MTTRLPLALALAPLFAAPPAHAVVIGFVDTGISALHPDFFDSEGHTRIAAIVDMTLAPRGRHPELERQGGAAFTGDEIEAAAAGIDLPDGAELPGDREGHGTHVAGIAAREAPGASLFVVRTDEEDRQAEDIAAGAVLFFDWAASRGEPAVLNLSLGRARGPRDGSAWVEELLDDLVGLGIPGRVVVASAGNDGWLPRHLRVAAEDGCSAMVEIDVRAVADGGVATLEVIGPPEAALSLIPPTGEALAPVPFGAQAVGTAGSSTFLVLAPDDAEPTARPRALVAIETLAAEDVTGTWLLELQGQGTFDLWIADPTDGLEVDAGIAADSLYSLRTPATADNVIVVAASVEGGGTRRAPFSSMGPTLDGRPKPDLSAPGENVSGALAAESVLAEPALAGLWTEDRQHIELSGTSQAAPRVSAAAARLLGRLPDLDAAQVRSLLVATARRPAGAAWTPEMGFGLLDVEAALSRLDDGVLELDHAREQEGARIAREQAGLAPPAVCAADPPPRACSAAPGVAARPFALLVVLALLVGNRWYRRRPWGRRGISTRRLRTGPPTSPRCPSGRGRCR